LQDFQDRQGRLSGKTQKLLADMEFGGCIGQLEICLYLGKMSKQSYPSRHAIYTTFKPDQPSG
ncbi:MAG: hypothetical protein WAW36_06995, partial [Methylovulum miyakonense]|uniref:hypothetical protein n=1 Tax=Methylovulum miyakonense TaxID=645578 RepID=UPI003BB6F3E0